MPAMENIPEPVYRVLSIDPGTNTLGVAVLDINVAIDHVLVQHAMTMHVGKLCMQYPQIIAVHGERVSKLHAAEKAMLKVLLAWKPDVIVCESPYMGAFPQAYAALVECVSAIRRAVMKYDRMMPLNMLDPTTVKKSVGITGRMSSDKTLVAKAVFNIPNLTFDGSILIANLDEHAVDAVAVGYAHYVQAQQGKQP